MPKKIHPADMAHAKAAAEAVRFDIALFAGGKYHTAAAQTYEEACAEAARLAAKHPTSRRPLIYGITRDGRAGLITPAIMAIMKETTMTTTKKTTKTQTPKAAKAPKAKKAVEAKPAKAPANGNAEKPARKLGKRAQIEADAQPGKLPSAPDFSAPTHERFRPKLAEVVALAKAGDSKGLRAYKINPVSSSPKAILRYRDLCVTALEAKAK